MALIQYADDFLFFLEATTKEVMNLRSILLIFEAASGLKVNLQKSKMMVVGPIQNRVSLAFILDC